MRGVMRLAGGARVEWYRGRDLRMVLLALEADDEYELYDLALHSAASDSVAYSEVQPPDAGRGPGARK